MNYSLVQPPFTLKFREMTKDQLQEYARWFHDSIPERINALTSAILTTYTFCDWQPNLTPDSLKPLGDWFAQVVELRKRSAEEIEDVRAKLTFLIDVPPIELTNRTFSIAFDIGMYFGSVVVTNVQGARWDVDVKHKRSADYGQPIIITGLGNPSLNPIRIAVTLAYGLADGTRTGGRLREVYDYWTATLSRRL